MADGTTKAIESIQVGDPVLAYDESSGTMAFSEVTGLHEPVVSTSHIVVNGFLHVTDVHPFLVKKVWTQASLLRVGDVLTMADGSSTRIHDLKRVEEPSLVYNFSVAMGTFVAQGVVVHNKDLPYEQQPCPECEIGE